MNKIATWNVNSLRVRLGHVLDWLQDAQPDVLCLQEIKMVNEDFPADAFREIGYAAVFNGQKTYNGVAILSKDTGRDIVTDLPELDDPQRRFLAATFGNVRVINVYVPNGQEVGSEKFSYKIDWFGHLQRYLVDQVATHAELVIVGDFNIAPADADVHDPEEWRGKIHCSDTERGLLHDLMALGLTDSFRHFDQPAETFSWWDYRAAAFRRNRGLRIDLILNTAALQARCRACYVDKAPRKLERPSDHTPVVAEYRDSKTR